VIQKEGVEISKEQLAACPSVQYSDQPYMLPAIHQLPYAGYNVAGSVAPYMSLTLCLLQSSMAPQGLLHLLAPHPHKTLTGTIANGFGGAEGKLEEGEVHLKAVWSWQGMVAVCDPHRHLCLPITLQGGHSPA
jgi:hypothetical protein